MSRHDFRLRRDRAGPSTSYWHLTDRTGSTVWEFLDYMIDCVDQQQLRPGTVEIRAHALARWYRYLDSCGIPFLEASDKVLKGFREFSLSIRSRNSSGNLQARMRSVNHEIRSVYLYYAWIQSHRQHSRGRRLIDGRQGQIRSHILESTCKARERFPLVFRNAAEKSRHRLGFVPTEVHRAQLSAYFYRSFSNDVARRNCLIFELAWNVGWRRGSILSLTVDDFECLRHCSDEELYITPRSQKFGHQHSFCVDFRTAAKVLNYIDNERRRVADKLKVDCPHVFLSYRNGLALQASTVSTIFSRAREALGWPLGAGLHAWRRGFVNSFLELELDARLELGLDTSSESIAMSIAQRLGHENVRSQAAYVRNSQRKLRTSSSFVDREDLRKLSDENVELRRRLEEAMQMLGASGYARKPSRRLR